VTPDDELYRRGIATLIISWQACAQGSPGGHGGRRGRILEYVAAVSSG